MAYQKTTWTDSVTDLSATNMNKIEQGISDAHTGLEQVNNNLLKISMRYVDYTMEANVERIITPSIAGFTSIDESRILAVIPFLAAASSGNLTSGIMVGVAPESAIKFKLKSTVAQTLYVTAWYIYK